MRVLRFVVLLSVLANVFAANLNDAKFSKREKGSVSFVSKENMGNVGFRGNHMKQQQFINDILPMLGLTGLETLNLRSDTTDRFGFRHLKFEQLNNGIEVDGGDFFVHCEENGEVFSLTLALLPNDRSAVYNEDLRRLKETPEKMIPFKAVKIAAKQLSPQAKVVSDPKLVFLLDKEEGYLAYKAEVEYAVKEVSRTGYMSDALQYMRSDVYANPFDGSLIQYFQKIATALEREVYSANNEVELPGTLERSEGQAPTTDPQVNFAYSNSGVCWEFYNVTFGRDSFNGQGAPMVSTVHFDKEYNNAFWDGKQMVYGDGDGVIFANFAEDLSVVCHELTHAVVEYTAQLRYKDDSGALNEGYADIMGASAVFFNQTVHQYADNAWLIGDVCYLNGTALRYMYNPPLDGVSYDYYPTRFIGIRDNGGVHWNSGIANLAFVLAVQSGVHPQQKTTNWVPPVGLEKALQIWYNVLENYLTKTSTYPDARVACEQAAKKLYGQQASEYVTAAWAAVGVPASSS